MKKKILFVFLIVQLNAIAQVKIGDNPTVFTSPNSTLLELEGITKALLLTRVTNVASIASPVNGMIVYDLTFNCVRAYEDGIWSDCLNGSGIVTVLTQIGNEGDSPNTVPSVVTAAQLSSVSGITGVVPANAAAYNAYIDANPNLFSAPATVAEVNAMITAVNASISILAQIGNEGDSPNTVPSVVTPTQLSSVAGITGVVPANAAAYNAYIDANPNLFSAPATVAEVNAMITAVNASRAVLAQIGNEADSPNTVPSVVTIAKINTIVPPVTGVIAANLTAYQAYIDTYPERFDLVATQQQVQAMVSSVNTTNGTAQVISYTCSTASAGTLTAGSAVSGVTQTITAFVAFVGTYNIATTTANGFTFSGSGTFTGTGYQNIVLTATGTPMVDGSNNFTLNTAPNCSFSRTILPMTIPATITLAQNRTYLVASVYDQDYLPYTVPTVAANTSAQAADGVNEAVTVNVQGTITTTGVNVTIPVTTTGSGTLPAYSTTITIPASITEDGISRDLTLSWASQAYTSTTKSINATIAAVGGTLNAKKIDVNSGIGNDGLGLLMGSFTYPYNNTGSTTTYKIRVISGIPDRKFGLPDNTGNSTTHMMLYLPVVAEDGKIWLNNNLGAHYANVNHVSFNPGQQATSATDYFAFGSLFQWGRKPDGHELITYTGSSVLNTSSAFSLVDNPNHALFIQSPSHPNYDWRVTKDDLLWATEASINNPCPVGFRVPTNIELQTLVTAAGITNVATAASSLLKFTAVGSRSPSSGNNYDYGSAGIYWSSSAYFEQSYWFSFSSSSQYGSAARARGTSVRCIKN